MTVLVVDDEEAIVELVAEYLRARGMNVVTAADGDQALASLERDAVDVVLTDLRLPVRGGMSLLEVIVERGLPVATVVMTGYGTIETATQALKLGAADYLLKPVRLRELHEALMEALARRSLATLRERARRTNQVYEKLLGLHGPVDPDDLLVQLAELARVESGASACRCALREGGAWRVVGEAARAAGPSVLPAGEVPVVQAGGAEGPALRLSFAGLDGPLPPALQERLTRLSECAVATLVASGTEDLPVIA